MVLTRVRGLLWVVGVVCALVLAACGSSGGGGDGGSGGGGKKGAVAMSFGDQSVALWKDMLDDMKPRIEAAGYDFLADDPKSNVQTQVNDWQGWIARGDVKAIMGYPIQVNSLVPVTRKAGAAKIAMLGYSQNWAGTKGALVTDPEKDGQLLGQQAAKWINDKLGGKANVAVLGGKTNDLLTLRTKGIVEGIKAGAPNARIDQLDTGLARTEGFNQAKSLLQRRGKVQVWVGVSDDPVAGAYRALMSSGVKPDDPDTFLGALDLTQGSIKIMAKPDSVWRMGYVFTRSSLVDICVRMLLAAAKGEPVSDSRVNPVLITPDNYRKYLSQI